MMAINNIDIALTGIGLGLVGLATTHALVAAINQLRKRTPKDNFYEDVDGKSTPESIAAFSNRLPKLFILAFSVTGFGTSTAISVLSFLYAPFGELFLKNWLIAGAWALIVLHAISLSAHHSPVKVHDLGLWLLASSIVVAAITVPQLSREAQHASREAPATLALRAVNVGAAIFLGLFSVLLPRRPDVFVEDRKVDGQWTVSAFNRYTWSWIGPLIKFAVQKKDLDVTDVPYPDRTLRAEGLKEDWFATKPKGSLVRSVFWAYKGPFVFQFSLTTFRNVLALLPFWAMLRVINILEQRDVGLAGSSNLELWVLIFAMAGLNLLDAWVEGWVFWYSFSCIALPIRSQLSTLIFEKSLRRKNVKSAEKSKEADESQEAPDKKKEDEPDDGSSVLKSQQAIVNLVGVDALRISNFTGFQCLIFNSIFKLFFFSFFLVRLIGWIPFVAGFTAWGLTLPANAYFSKELLGRSDKLMKLRDEKLAVVNEALLGMRQIKFAALESRWEKRILTMRERELKTLWGLFVIDTGLFGCWVVSPILLAATSLAVYAIVNGQLLPSVAFVSIGIFKALEVSLGVLPELITMGVDTYVSLKRIQTYLNGPEMKQTLSEGTEVAFENATIAWPEDDEKPDEDRFILRNLNFSFPAGELSVVSGKTGTGKSLLLSAILGETDILEGSVCVPQTVSPEERHDAQAHPGDWILPGSVAYVGQTPWLESASLRDNILFGLPFIEERYNQTVEVCALKKDLQILTDGDKTELGANGINLSGGQKWRVTLARAIYSRAEILVMDDVFSAVDAHVGRHIFEKCVIGDICKGRTRILVTHHVALVQSKAKYIVELGEGMALHCGLVADFIRDGTLDEIRQHEESAQPATEDETMDSSTAVNSSDASVTDPTETNENNPLQKVPSKAAKQFVEEEAREKGMVKKHVYLTYLKDSGGARMWSICAIVFLAFEFGILARAWWLRIWTGDVDESVSTGSIHQQHGHASVFSLQHFPYNSAPEFKAASHYDLKYYLWIYIAISCVTAIVGTFRFFWAYYLAIKASRSLFEKMLFMVLHTPLRWLDTVPVGRILNRFSSDFNIVDNRITIDWTQFISNLLSLVGVCVAAFFASGFVIPLAIALLGLGCILGNRFLYGARPLKRLESTCKSPVFELFNAALAGVSTIRGYKKSRVYMDRMYQKLDTWAIITSYMWLVNRWMGLRMGLIGTIFSITVGIIVIVSPSMDAALAGFTLSFAMDFAESILWTIRNYATMELNMNATERIVEYTELETESLEGEKPSAAWPTSGTMKIDNLEVSYAPDLPPVLRGISFDVKNNERVGVVGRTGAGKSSLTLALFRFLEARSGSVTIDGLDISKVDLHSLRSRLAIIPQDPVLFSGTIRSNLDPFEDNTDDELRESLSRVHLVDSQPATPANEPSSAATSTIAVKNTNIFRDLSSPISESGGNLSQGQRQLLCLARAIVARPKIMVLDEATSAVDMTTDALIQRSIREEFTDSTLIVIAHRLSTIADFDRILVLSEGQVAEFGTPKELYEQQGVFRDMCDSSGEKEKLKQTIFG